MTLQETCTNNFFPRTPLSRIWVALSCCTRKFPGIGTVFRQASLQIPQSPKTMQFWWGDRVTTRFCLVWFNGPPRLLFLVPKPLVAKSSCGFTFPSVSVAHRRLLTHWLKDFWNVSQPRGRSIGQKKNMLPFLVLGGDMRGVGKACRTPWEFVEWIESFAVRASHFFTCAVDGLRATVKTKLVPFEAITHFLTIRRRACRPFWLTNLS